MFRKRKNLIILMVLILLFLGYIFIRESRIIQEQTLAIELNIPKLAPNFALPDLNGNIVHLSDFQGKIILLDFWASWCPVCRDSIPILQSLYAEYKDKGLAIVGIALEYDGGKRLKRFAEENTIDYPVVVGKESLAIAYSVYGVPTRFLINRRGEIVERFIGFQDKETLEYAIRKLL